MEISVGIIFSTFTKETSQTESDARISRLLQQLDKLRPAPSQPEGVGLRESQASASTRAQGPSLLALLHPSRQKPIYASEGGSVNLHHPVTGPQIWRWPLQAFTDQNPFRMLKRAKTLPLCDRNLWRPLVRISSHFELAHPRPWMLRNPPDLGSARTHRLLQGSTERDTFCIPTILFRVG